jgi:hypothetical protein
MRAVPAVIALAFTVGAVATAIACTGVLLAGVMAFAEHRGCRPEGGLD